MLRISNRALIKFLNFKVGRLFLYIHNSFIFNFWNLSFWKGISNLNKVILMLYHYIDNDNVLLLKMFQILGKYNIEFE